MGQSIQASYVRKHPKWLTQRKEEAGVRSAVLKEKHAVNRSMQHKEINVRYT